MCTMHDCDLAGEDFLLAERLCDLDETIMFGSEEDAQTGYYLFDFSHAECLKNSNPVHTSCHQFWKTVLYT